MRLLDSDIDIDASKYLLFKEYRALFVLLLLSALMDAASTTYFMQRTGPGPELNVVVRLLSYAYGPIAGPLLGKIYQIFAVWVLTLLTPKLSRFVCAMIIVFNCYATMINMTV
jgi:hypothetical protein